MPNRLKDLGIEHVVVLMLENRGFDHVMGWLYGEDDHPMFISNEDGEEPFLGLSMLTEKGWQGIANVNPLEGDPEDPHATIEPIAGARSPMTPQFNPGEHFVHIMTQMWGERIPDWGDKDARDEKIAEIQHQRNSLAPPMTGYMVDYAYVMQHEAGVVPDESNVTEIIETFTPEQLPVLNSLARHYSVSDQWFCSVPSQTNTNRAFSMAGTSRGLVTNNFYDAHRSSWNPGVNLLKWASGGSHADQIPGYPRNVLRILSDYGVDWTLFWQSEWPPRDLSIGVQYQYVKTMFPELAESKFKPNFVKIDASDPENELFARARAGHLPAVSWIEPKWGGGTSWTSKKRQVGNDMHPVSDTTVTEDFVAALYDALTLREDGSPNPFWERTLFIITFDENGGTYDHYPPPPATPTNRDRAPEPVPYPHIDEETRTEFGFDFAQFGVRVPTLLISPFVDRETLFRTETDTPYDHTSLIASILDWADIPKDEWLLGARVAAAPTFENVLRREDARAPDDPEEGIRYSVSSGVARPDTDPLTYGEEVYLQYIGNKWHNPTAPLYLAAAASYRGVRGKWWYPTLAVEPEDAVAVRLFADLADDNQDPIDNMSVIRVATSEEKVNGYNVLGAFHDSHYLYYYKPTDHRGERWQIRILSSRDPEDQVREEDEVYLVSQLPPTKGQSVSQRATPDPLQRMVISPKNPEYLTTLAGVWAIWRVLRELPD